MTEPEIDKEVRTILKRHQIHVCDQGIICCQTRDHSLLDSLCSLITALIPEREEPRQAQLNHILLKHFDTMDHVPQWDSLVSDLWTWATGKKKEMVWCEHLKWFGKRFAYNLYPKNKDNLDWQYIAGDWSYCPRCGAKRPKGE